jgi:uncharacterized membrane protein YozB (DUF420 family)
MPSGFLPGSRASFTLDLIVIAMAIVLPAMIYSLLLVRRHKDYKGHRNMQIVLGVVLGLAIIAFELDMRLRGWRHLAADSPYYESLVFPALYVHLAFAIPTLVLWSYTIFQAIRYRIIASGHPTRFRHKTFGRLSAYTMIATTLTGWIFYCLAFVAT